MRNMLYAFAVSATAMLVPVEMFAQSSAGIFAPRLATPPARVVRRVPLDQTPSVVNQVRTPKLGSGEARSSRSAIRTGALIGAGAGFAVGLYGGIRIADGMACNRANCNESGAQARQIIFLSAAGAGLGALVGAGVGGIVHALRQRK